jgi:hypothetical protein
MEHVVGVIARVPADANIGDCSLAKIEPLPRLGADLFANVFEIPGRASGEIIDSDDALLETEKGLQQMRADEAGNSRDQPRRAARRRVRCRRFDRRS